MAASMDKPAAALIKDLKARGMLDDTIVIWTTEFGRMPWIMMENHGYSQVLNNPNLPYTNTLVGLANSATNYFAIAHPSLTNYLEVVGGSSFGVHSQLS